MCVTRPPHKRTLACTHAHTLHATSSLLPHQRSKASLFLTLTQLQRQRSGCEPALPTCTLCPGLAKALLLRFPAHHGRPRNRCVTQLPLPLSIYSPHSATGEDLDVEGLPEEEAAFGAQDADEVDVDAALAIPAVPPAQYGPRWYDRLADIPSVPESMDVADVLDSDHVNEDPDGDPDIDGLVVEVPVQALALICPHWSYTVLADRRPPQGELLAYTCAVATAPYNVWIRAEYREAVHRGIQKLPGRSAVSLHRNTAWLLPVTLTLDGDKLVALLADAGMDSVVVQGAYGSKSTLSSTLSFLHRAAMVAVGGPPAEWQTAHPAGFRAYVDVAQQFPPLFPNEHSFFSVVPVDADGNLVETRLEQNEKDYHSLSHVLRTAGGSVKLTRFPMAMLLTDRCHGGVQIDYPAPDAAVSTCTVKTKVYSRLRQEHTALFGASNVPGTGTRPKQLKTVMSRLAQTDQVVQRMRDPGNWSTMCGYRVENTVRVHIPVKATGDDYASWLSDFVSKEAEHCTLAAILEEFEARAAAEGVEHTLGFTVVQVGASALARHAGVIHAALHAELSRVNKTLSARPRMHIMFLHWLSLSAVGVFSLYPFLYATGCLRGKFAEWMAPKETSAAPQRGVYTWIVRQLEYLCATRGQQDIPFLQHNGTWEGLSLDKPLQDKRAQQRKRDAQAAAGRAGGRAVATPAPLALRQPARLFGIPAPDPALRDAVAQQPFREALEKSKLLRAVEWIKTMVPAEGGLDCNQLLLDTELRPVFRALQNGLDWKLCNSTGKQQWELRNAATTRSGSKGSKLVRANNTIAEGIVKLLTTCSPSESAVKELLASLPFLPAGAVRAADYIRDTDWEVIHRIVEGVKWESVLEGTSTQTGPMQRLRWGINIKNLDIRARAKTKDKRGWPLTQVEMAATLYNAVWFVQGVHWWQVVDLREGCTIDDVTPDLTINNRRVTRNAVSEAVLERGKRRGPVEARLPGADLADLFRPAADATPARAAPAPQQAPAAGSPGQRHAVVGPGEGLIPAADASSSRSSWDDDHDADGPGRAAHEDTGHPTTASGEPRLHATDNDDARGTECPASPNFEDNSDSDWAAAEAENCLQAGCNMQQFLCAMLPVHESARP